MAKKPGSSDKRPYSGPTNRETWLWIAAIALLYVVVRMHALAIPLDRDEGVFGYIAQRILEGGLPYRDALDHKPPGVFYLYALALRVVPATPSGVHFFLHAYNLLTLAAVAFLLHLRFRSRWAWLGGAFSYALFSASPAIQGFTASTEMFMLLPITLSVLLAVAGRQTGKPIFLMLSGAAGAAAFWIKQTAAASVGFALVYLVASNWLEDRPSGQVSVSRIARDLLSWSLGAAVISAAIVGYFYRAGLIHEFIYWSFTHNVVYTGQVPLTQTASMVGKSLGGILRGDFAMIGLGVGMAAWTWRKRRSDCLFVLGFLTFSLLGTLPGFAYPHYFAQLAPAVAVLSGWALSCIASRARRPERAFFLLLLALSSIPIYVHRDFFVQLEPDKISRSIFGLNPFPESPELSAYLTAHTSAQDHIFILGSEPQILFQAHRKSATPFAMIYPLTRKYPRYLEFQESVWKDIQQDRPAYVLVVNIPTSILWDGQAKVELFEHLQHMLQEEYQMEAVMPVQAGKGELVLVNGQALPNEVAQNQTNIYLYHRLR